MKIADRKYFKEYAERNGNKIRDLIRNFDFSEENNFEYLIKASAVYSSNIEGTVLI